MRKKNKS